MRNRGFKEQPRYKHPHGVGEQISHFALAAGGEKTLAKLYEAADQNKARRTERVHTARK